MRLWQFRSSMTVCWLWFWRLGKLPASKGSDKEVPNTSAGRSDWAYLENLFQSATLESGDPWNIASVNILYSIVIVFGSKVKCMTVRDLIMSSWLLQALTSMCFESGLFFVKTSFAVTLQQCAWLSDATGGSLMSTQVGPPFLCTPVYVLQCCHRKHFAGKSKSIIANKHLYLSIYHSMNPSIQNPLI